MKINNIEIEEEKLIEEIKNNKEFLEFLSKKYIKRQKGWFTPNRGERFYFIRDGEVASNEFCHFSKNPIMCDEDVKIRETQQVFRTEEEAQKELEKQKAKIRILRTIAEENKEKGWVVDWEDEEQRKVCLFIDLPNSITSRYTYCFNKDTEDGFYFSAKSEATILEKCSEDFKIYLGVE